MQLPVYALYPTQRRALPNLRHRRREPTRRRRQCRFRHSPRRTTLASPWGTQTKTGSRKCYPYRSFSSRPGCPTCTTTSPATSRATRAPLALRGIVANIATRIADTRYAPSQKRRAARRPTLSQQRPLPDGEWGVVFHDARTHRRRAFHDAGRCRQSVREADRPAALRIRSERRAENDRRFHPLPIAARLTRYEQNTKGNPQ